MKTRMIITTVIAALTMVSCTKYYRVLENDTPVYDELDDSAPVLFTLNKGEVVYSQTSVRNWVMVNRETVKEYHREQTVKTETDYDIYGRKTITNYVRPGYWTSKVVSKTVDVYSHYKRCYNCRHEYIFATEEKEV